MTDVIGLNRSNAYIVSFGIHLESFALQKCTNIHHSFHFPSDLSINLVNTCTCQTNRNNVNKININFPFDMVCQTVKSISNQFALYNASCIVLYNFPTIFFNNVILL